MPTDALVTPPRIPNRASFWVGATLVVVSFGIYPAYPLVPFLPMSTWQKGGVGIALAAVSWGMFLAGSALVGKKGVAYLKQRFFWQGGAQSRPDLTRGVSRRQP
jgi:hypothetical protein